MINTKNYENRSIILGQDVCNKAIFKVLDVLCVDKGPVKPIWDKTTEKLLNVDSLDYLKSQYKVQTESFTSQNIDNTTKRNCKRKLYQLKCQLIEHRDTIVMCLSPLLDTNEVASNLEVSRWFSQKLIANHFVTPTKIVCREVSPTPFHINSEVIYVSPIFYKSQELMIINNKKIIFNLYLKEWFKIELLFEYVKSITVYAKRPFIQVTIRTKIADEISKLYQRYNMSTSDVFRGSPRKAQVLKDVMLVFTSNQLSKYEYWQLAQIVGIDKMIWNESDTETTEILENILMKNSHKIEIINSHGCTDWSLIFKPNCGSKTAISTKHNLSSIIPCSFANIPPPPPPPLNIINLDKIPSPPPMTLQNVNKIQSQPVVTQNMSKIQPNVVPHVIAIKPTLSVISAPKAIKTQISSTSVSISKKKQHQQLISKVTNIQPQPSLLSQSQGLINYIVTTSTPAINFDSISNIFHRMRTDSQTIIPYQLSTIGPNISVAALNQFIANGSRSNQQSIISLPVIVNVDGGTTTTNNVTSKPLQSTNLMYIPSRNINNVFETFHYNPSPDSDVLIHGSDLLCLNFGQYLNDNIINFYLNFIRYEIMSEDQRQRTHLFNVFFNTKLQGTPNNVTDTAEVRHARVAKWTKKVDIFDKDFIIIPICENQHWFLAIICFPWMAGMISYEQLLGNNEDAVNEIPVNESKFVKVHRVNRVKMLKDEYHVEPSPCILLFDSLQYASRAPNVKLIREYLKTEWDSKRKATDGPLIFDKNTMRGFNPQVPQQTNNIDCGIFVLHYVEQFFIHPLPVFTKEYFQSSLLTWFKNETVANKRATIQNMVLAKADAYQAFCETTSHKISENSTTNVQQNYDDSGSDIQIL